MAGAAESAKGGAVLAPAKRIEALKLATQVLAPRSPTWKTTTASLSDPFIRTNFVPEEKPAEVEPEVKQSERSDRDVLETAANTLNPTGTMMVDGENYLLLGGKRYKAGAQIAVTIDGIVYSVVISAIDGKSYTLRLNDQELLRQLK
jgi:hypothetical protein